MAFVLKIGNPGIQFMFDDAGFKFNAGTGQRTVGRIFANDG